MSERNIVQLAHRYHVAQEVEFLAGSGIDRGAKGRFTIVRLLPIEGTIPQYRVKNKTDGHERVVYKNELR